MSKNMLIFGNKKEEKNNIIDCEVDDPIVNEFLKLKKKNTHCKKCDKLLPIGDNPPFCSYCLFGPDSFDYIASTIEEPKNFIWDPFENAGFPL